MKTVDLESLMSPEEATRIGVADMTEAQRQALADWARRISAFAGVASATIASVKYGGRLIVLSDGSRWEVDEMDGDTADFWGAGARIVVVGDEMYLLEDLESISVQSDE